MSWRAGLEMFTEMLPVVDRYEPDEALRLDFKARLLGLFLDNDVDSCGIEDDPVIGPIYAKCEELNGAD